ncbi:MAG TPA: molybdenum cofactor guanylyltransferase [Firmicutes bacterium]|nr:molybdenum cofactor guanylyltransferase [Bacillota bacterium]
MEGFGSAVILAGGRSTRMGFDKQLLKMDDKRVCHHLIALLCTRFDDIMVATRTPHLYADEDVRIIPDIYQGIGPLGGIHAALVYAKSEAVFTVACDMPFLALPYIDYMMSQMEGRPYDACVTRREGHLETLHAFYCRSALPVLDDAVSQGRYSVHRFTQEINALVIPQETAAPFLPNWLAFTNINTPEEYEMFLQQMRTPLFGVL